MEKTGIPSLKVGYNKVFGYQSILLPKKKWRDDERTSRRPDIHDLHLPAAPRFYPRRAVGSDCDHRHPGSPVVARGAGSPGSCKAR